MGVIARTGISGGERVALERLGCRSEPDTGTFGYRSLHRLGFGPIARHVSTGRPLAVAEIHTLLTKAPLAVLMKLVELRASTTPVRPATPIVVLPLGQWGALPPAAVVERASALLTRIEYPALQVFLDDLDLDRLGGELESIITAIAACRPGLTIVGPAAEDILTWLHGPRGRPAGVTLTGITAALRAAGVHRLGASHELGAVQQIRSADFSGSLCLDLDRARDPGALAAAIAATGSVAASERCIEVWFPGLSRESGRHCFPGVALDLLMLRVLAIGTVAIPHVPYRRASNRYLSLDAVRVAHLFGANEFGFGAIDGLTADVLELQSYERLREVRLPAGV